MKTIIIGIHCIFTILCSAEVTRVDMRPQLWYTELIFAEWLQQNVNDMDIWLLLEKGRIPEYEFKQLNGEIRVDWIKLLQGAEFKAKGVDYLLIDFDDDYYQEKEKTYGFIVIKQKDGTYIGFRRNLRMHPKNALEPIYVKEFNGKNGKLLWDSRFDSVGLMLTCGAEKLFTSKEKKVSNVKK